VKTAIGGGMAAQPKLFQEDQVAESLLWPHEVYPRLLEAADLARQKLQTAKMGKVPWEIASAEKELQERTDELTRFRFAVATSFGTMLRIAAEDSAAFISFALNKSAVERIAALEAEVGKLKARRQVNAN
jgi:hypothetical protein